MTVIAFLSGSVMYSYFVPKFFYHIDVRKSGSDANPGAANAISAVGLPLGLLCMAFDVLKALVPVYIAVSVIHLSGFYIVPVIVAPVFGHAFSPFLKFRGGKAISATFGSLLGILFISRVVFVFAIVLFVLKLVIRVKPDSAMVIMGLLVANALLVFIEPLREVELAVLIMSVVVCAKVLLQPDKGALSLQVWHYAIIYENRRIAFRRG